MVPYMKLLGGRNFLLKEDKLFSLFQHRLPLWQMPVIVERRGEGQKLILFRQGNTMSGAPIIRSTNQFPKPPIMMGMTIKKIMTNAWTVTITL